MRHEGTETALRVLPPKSRYALILCHGQPVLARDGVCGCGQPLSWLVTT